MDFSQPNKYLKAHAKNENITNFDICVYYNRTNVYGYKKNARSFTNNLYSIDSIEKLFFCVALLKLNQDQKISLDSEVSAFLSVDCPNVSICDFMHSFFYAGLEDDVYNFANMKQIVETCSNQTYNDYIFENVIKPLKIKSALSSSKVNTFITASINDCARFLDMLFADGHDKNICKVLSDQNINTLVNNIIFKNKSNDDKVIKIKNDNDFIVIDIPKNITIIFAQNTQDVSNEQLEKYEIIVDMIYKGSGVTSWSKGFNVFP